MSRKRHTVGYYPSFFWGSVCPLQSNSRISNFFGNSNVWFPSHGVGDWPSPPVVSDGSTYLNGSRLLGRMDSIIYILRRAMELVNCVSCCSYSCLCHIYPLYIYLATYVWGKNLVKQTSWLTMALTPQESQGGILLSKVPDPVPGMGIGLG